VATPVFHPIFTARRFMGLTFDLRQFYYYGTSFITKAINAQPVARQAHKTGHLPLGFIPSSAHVPNWDKKCVPVQRAWRSI
jgi:hypothetical protein